MLHDLLCVQCKLGKISGQHYGCRDTCLFGCSLNIVFGFVHRNLKPLLVVSCCEV